MLNKKNIKRPKKIMWSKNFLKKKLLEENEYKLDDHLIEEINEVLGEEQNFCDFIEMALREAIEKRNITLITQKQISELTKKSIEKQQQNWCLNQH